MKPVVLIIDDEETLRKLLARVVELEGYHVLQASTAKEAYRLVRKELIHVIISDVKLPDANGLDVSVAIKKDFPATEIILLTAFGSIQDGVSAIKQGAFDYLTKGDHQEKIIPLLSKAVEKAQLQQRVLQLESKLQERFGFQNILGNSKRLRDSVDLARKVSSADATVLLLGETGTGKEVFAQAIHYESPRKSRNFVALNCSAFPKDLLESELFGHAEGAFTGATRAKKGYIDEANEGTLFLDEIGEMNLDLQAKLLRVLETGEFYRVGETKPRHVNVRFIAATNRNLARESETGEFRKDLYYRLSVFTISLPSLRDRKDDIPVIADFFIKQFALKTNKKGFDMSTGFLKDLQQHSWKGNIRELKNVIERCVILADESTLTTPLLPSDFNLNEGPHENSFNLAGTERSNIIKAMAHTGGNKTQAAKLLGIGLTTLYQKIRDYDLA